MTVACEWKLRVFQGLKNVQIRWLLRMIFLNDPKVRNASKESTLSFHPKDQPYKKEAPRWCIMISKRYMIFGEALNRK